MYGNSEDAFKKRPNPNFQATQVPSFDWDGTYKNKNECIVKDLGHQRNSMPHALDKKSNYENLEKSHK